MPHALTENGSVQWTGANFSHVYDWLISRSQSKDIVLRVLDPGNPRSTIQLEVGGLMLQLNVGDHIIRSVDGLYYVFEEIEE